LLILEKVAAGAQDLNHHGKQLLNNWLTRVIELLFVREKMDAVLIGGLIDLMV